MVKNNKAILEQQNKLVCAYCSVIFVGSYSQARHFLYENRKTYCSEKCRKAAVKDKCREAAITRGSPLYVPQGPCPTCGKYFNSAMPKKFCSMTCYTSSPEFKIIAKEASEKAVEINKQAYLSNNPGGVWNKTNVVKKCLQCEEEFIAKRSDRKYCSVNCYRQHLAYLYDRWIANPQKISSLQCFDEFMTKEFLPCLIEGCDWEGHNLSVHLNMAHGIRAEDFKKAAGFNLTTGLVSPSLRKKLEARELYGVAVLPQYEHEKFKEKKGTKPAYISLEGKEHRKKIRALKAESGEIGHERVCKNCKKIYNAPLGVYNSKFCNVTCRNEFYNIQKKLKRFAPKQCIVCGNLFTINNEFGIASKYCSVTCRSKFYRGKKNKAK